MGEFFERKMAGHVTSSANFCSVVFDCPERPAQGIGGAVWAYMSPDHDGTGPHFLDAITCSWYSKYYLNSTAGHKVADTSNHASNPVHLKTCC